MLTLCLARRTAVDLRGLRHNSCAKPHLLPARFVLTTLGQIDINSTGKKSGTWFSRKILRRISSSQNFKHKHDGLTKRRRSISDLSLRLKSKGNTFKDKDLQELVRLCGLSLVYLPTEYAISSLAVPTCFRATAQYLIQNGQSLSL